MPSMTSGRFMVVMVGLGDFVGEEGDGREGRGGEVEMGRGVL